jgi:HD-GYP domain-containing protein (c-di-GMP phosphodiesterase class II)
MAQFQQACETSLMVLANAIEVRDKYTRGHVERVKKLSEVAAEQMGLPDSMIRSLQFGAILHDIGKIYVREGILRKAGPLSEEEWNEMKRHTVEGFNLLANNLDLKLAIPIIRYHHERWDGMGYPDGLAGEQIPLGARIVAVADSLDAMTSSRVYQTPNPPQQALNEIVSGSGTHYDPAVVQAYLTVWDRISAILETG